jgi:hypothetical protein
MQSRTKATVKTFTNAELIQMGYVHCYDDGGEPAGVELLAYHNDEQIVFRCNHCQQTSKLRLIDMFEQLGTSPYVHLFEYAKRQDTQKDSSSEIPQPLDKKTSLDSYEGFRTYFLYLDGKLQRLNRDDWKLWCVDNYFSKDLAQAECSMLMLASPMGRWIFRHDKSSGEWFEISIL